MRKYFPGHFKLDQNEIKDLWNDALITLDANILLNLYRYSDETREIFFQIFEKCKERIWIPYQSAKEFFDNRLTVINQQEKAYDDAIEALKTVEEEFKNSRQHPFISQKSLKKFSDLRKEICDELNKNKQYHNKRITDDEILNRIDQIFDNKVGKEFSQEKLDELYKEGEKRFADKIPPGYKDSNKKDSTNKNIRKFGDYIVWEQIILKSKNDKINTILVTDDRKEDWWVRFKGKTIGARPELIKEFKDRTEQLFHMYRADRFLEFAREYFEIDVKQKSIDEIRALRKLDEEKRLKKISHKREIMRKNFEEEFLQNRIQLADHINMIEQEKEKYEEILNHEYKKLKNEDPSAFDWSQIESLKNELEIIDTKERELKHQFNNLKLEYINSRNKTLHNIG